MRKLGYSPDHGSYKVNVYKEPGSSFIRCHEIDLNNEHIYNLQQDGTIQDGIFIFRKFIGDTIKGSRYFRRSGREEDRTYCLYRSNIYGNIYYQDLVWGKEDSGWRYLAHYKFNQETLEWTKLEV